MRPNIRFFALISVALLGGATASACNSSGPSGVFTISQWRIRCDTMHMCAGYPDREVRGFNGELGQSVTCNVSESATNRTLSFNAARGGQFGIELGGAVFSSAGGAVSGAGCLVRVRESDNTWEGRCSAADPNPTTPCRVNNVQFTRDPDDNRPLVTGQIYCVGLSPSGDPTRQRELTIIGDDPGAGTMPMNFAFFDCTGFHPE